ncbi:amidoligase family protein, partial [Ruthenibacterium lactatiformans]|uniref:amidoligase family protein n=1 Tax=Ruthenibacterium lactatiformans TaxID=1550024 RepID=UPI0022E769AE
MTGITREQAAQAVAALFGTTARQTHESHTYDPWEVIDNDGKKWRFVYDGSIDTTHLECGEQVFVSDRKYSVEMNSPKLEYSEMKKLQKVVRTLRRAGAAVNESCGMHVHVDASGHTPRSLRNALSIMYSKEDLIFKAIGANTERIQQYCQYSRENVVRTVRALSPHLTMEQL